MKKLEELIEGRNITLKDFLDDFVKALKIRDKNDTIPYKKCPLGIGCFREPTQVKRAMEYLSKTYPKKYRNYKPPPKVYYQDSSEQLDLLLPNEWVIEFKRCSLLGGMEESNEEDSKGVSEAICYPFLPKNGSPKSLVGDCIKLSRSKFKERKAVVLIYYEGEKDKMPEDFDINVLIELFEYIIPKVSQNKFKLGERCETKWKDGLIHPNHQKVKLYGWEILTD